MKHISAPALLLDESKCRRNIRIMTSKMKQHGLLFRPHFKTHQSRAIGCWFREEGVEAISVSSVKMAEYFAQDGWKKITIAFPVNIRQLDRLAGLSRTVQLDVLISDKDAIPAFRKFTGSTVNAWVEIDTGYGRSGLPATGEDRISATIKAIENSEGLALKGFLSHTGNTYNASESIEGLFKDAMNQLLRLKNTFETGPSTLLISLGDTPSATVLDDFYGVDELRPGNFVFYDLMQYTLGVCSIDDIAVAVACPVVARYPERNEVVLYGGAVHLSKEFLEISGTKVFGYAALLKEKGWQFMGKGNFVTSISQEHGILRMDRKSFKLINTGDLIGILPVHSCLTSNLMKRYQTLDGQELDHLQGVSSFGYR